MRQLPGELYKIPKRKNKSFFICKKMNKKLHKKNPSPKGQTSLCETTLSLSSP